MRALQFAEYGGPEKLQLATLPDPAPAAGMIAETHTLDQGQDAYRSVQNGTRGRVVISPQSKA